MIEKLSALLRRGETTALSLAQQSMARINARNAETNAFITVTKEQALVAAASADARIKEGEAPLLCGIPVAVKDNIAVAGVRTTAASQMLSDFYPPYSAAAWEHLAAAGAVLVGKTNLDEFAMGGSGEKSAFGAVHNPQNLSYVAGGSSAGSAAAVADGQAVYALGSDTGGSVRVPAAFCGVVGLNPTYGRVSRRGLISFASSLDTVGIVTQTVRDAAIVLDAVAAPDAGDMTSLPRNDTLSSWLTAIDGGISGMRIGVVPTLPGLSVEVAAAYTRAIETVAAQGAHLVEITLPRAEDTHTAYYVISAAEAASNLARYDGIRYGHAEAGTTYTEEMRCARRCFGEEVKRRLLAGTFALSFGGRAELYDRACRLRNEITAAFAAQFALCDVILIPTAPDTAGRIGAGTDTAMPDRQSDALCTGAALVGVPAISVPVATAGTLPIGMQLIAPAMQEGKMFAVAASLTEEVQV